MRSRSVAVQPSQHALFAFRQRVTHRRVVVYWGVTVGGGHEWFAGARGGDLVYQDARLRSLRIVALRSDVGLLLRSYASPRAWEIRLSSALKVMFFI